MPRSSIPPWPPRPRTHAYHAPAQADDAESGAAARAAARKVARFPSRAGPRPARPRSSPCPPPLPPRSASPSSSPRSPALGSRTAQSQPAPSLLHPCSPADMVCAHKQRRARKHTHSRGRHTRALTYARTRKRARPHAHARTHARERAHMHANARTFTRAPSVLLSSPSYLSLYPQCSPMGFFSRLSPFPQPSIVPYSLPPFAAPRCRLPHTRPSSNPLPLIPSLHPGIPGRDPRRGPHDRSCRLVGCLPPSLLPWPSRRRPSLRRRRRRRMTKAWLSGGSAAAGSCCGSDGWDWDCASEPSAPSSYFPVLFSL